MQPKENNWIKWDALLPKGCNYGHQFRIRNHIVERKSKNSSQSHLHLIENVCNLISSFPCTQGSHEQITTFRFKTNQKIRITQRKTDKNMKLTKNWKEQESYRTISENISHCQYQHHEQVYLWSCKISNQMKFKTHTSLTR